MKKGQSLIIEFILFFMVSFSLFAVISAFFFNQNQFFKGRVGDKLADTVNNLVSSHIVKGVTCKSCTSVEVQEDLPSKIGGYYYRVFLDQEEGLNTTLVSRNLYSRKNQLFLLNESFQLLDSKSKSENKIIEIQINIRDKEIRVG